MKDNISTNSTLNRKIIVELRFESNPRILDVRGSIIESIKKLNLFSINHWELGDSALMIKDAANENFVRNKILIDLNRFAFTSSKIDSVESFFSKFSKVKDAVNQYIELDNLDRIGCRIQGTYKIKSNDFKDVLTSFKNSFPSQIFLEDFPCKDLMLRLDYQNGMYNIGPINKNDNFLKKEFSFEDRNNSVGIAIDTDNFLTKDKKNKLNTSKIKDVLVASLAVEKSLYEKMKDF